ncbi:MAG: hypothetical protein ACK5R4_04295 [Alphaproteobacteria bacterium]|jgi:hypothetical protein
MKLIRHTQRKISRSDEKRPELVLEFRDGQGNTRSFALGQHEIIPLTGLPDEDSAPGENNDVKRKKVRQDWFETIPPQEKASIFMNILDYYRERSEGDKGIKAAAIGVFRDPETGKTRIFIGMNTKRQHLYFKDCAELNMMGAATHALNHSLSSKKKEIGSFKPAPLEVHVMGGSSEKDRKKGIKTPIICPCGKCIDMFAVSDVKAETPFYVYPVSQEPIQDRWEGKDLPYQIVDEKTAENISQVNSAQHIWNVPFDHLNKNRVLTAEKRIATLEKSGLKSALKHIVMEEQNPITLPDVAIGFSKQAAVHYGHPATPAARLAAALVAQASGRDKWVKVINRDGSEKSTTEVKRYLAVVARAAQNAANGVKSIPELDVARTLDGAIDFESVNKVMVEKIVATMASRLRGCKKDIDPIKDPHWQEKFLAKLGTVRCAVIQLKDGSFHYGLEVIGELDSALPNAEVNSLTASLERLGEVKQVFVMEMNSAEIARLPDHIPAQPKFHTSPKEGVERILKRAMPGVTFHFLPFNHADISNNILEEVVKTYTAPEISPGGFGYRPESSEAHSR